MNYCHRINLELVSPLFAVLEGQSLSPSIWSSNPFAQMTFSIYVLYRIELFLSSLMGNAWFSICIDCVILVDDNSTSTYVSEDCVEVVLELTEEGRKRRWRKQAMIPWKLCIRNVVTDFLLQRELLNWRALNWDFYTSFFL